MTLQPSTAFTQEMQMQPQQLPAEPVDQPAPQPQFAQPQPPVQPTPQQAPVFAPAPSSDRSAQAPAPQPFATAPEPAPQFAAPEPVAAPVFAPQPMQPQGMQPQPPVPQGPAGTIGSSPGGVYEPPKRQRFSPKLLKIGIPVLAALLLIGTAAALLLTDVISLDGFKKVNFTSQRGTEYSFRFYKSHAEVRSATGGTGLISDVSRNEKFPIVINISSSDDTGSKRFSEDCKGFKKIMDVQNSNLNQTLAVCGFSGDESSDESGVYISEFIANDMNHLVTISQDYSTIDFTNEDAVDGATAKFGLSSYDEDIKRILSSIKLK